MLIFNCMGSRGSHSRGLRQTQYPRPQGYHLNLSISVIVGLLLSDDGEELKRLSPSLCIVMLCIVMLCSKVIKYISDYI